MSNRSKQPALTAPQEAPIKVISGARRHCYTCPAFERSSKDGGSCHAGPPMTSFAWPKVSNADWCMWEPPK